MAAPSPSSGVPAHQLEAPRGMTPIRTWVASGLRCALVRAPLWGAINGYVRVPSIQPGQQDEVEVHGGVTFGPDRDGWIGFDTLHGGDIWPDAPSSRAERDWGRTWTEDQVAAETERMAASAKAVMEQ